MAQVIVELLAGGIVLAEPFAEPGPILADRGRTIVPDILANAGGVTVSYFEWVQDRESFFWSESEIYQRLQSIMERAFDDVWQRHETEQTTLREAALLLAIERVARALQQRGLYP